MSLHDILDLHCRRERRFHFGDDEVGVVFESRINVTAHLLAIGSPKNLDKLNVGRLDTDFDVISTRKEGEGKVLKEMFLEVSILSGAEIVESFDILELLTSAGDEVIRNSNNGGVNH